MVTTQLDFMHLRTTAGLAQQVRRLAGRMRRKRFAKHLKEHEDKLRKAIDKGDIDGVKNAFEHILGLAEKKEHYLYIIEKDELILLNEEEKAIGKEVDLNNQLKPFLDQLASSHKELFDEYKRKIDDPLHQVCSDIRARTDQIRRVLAYLKSDNVAGVTRQDFLMKFRSERGIERTIRREARLEKKYVKSEMRGIDKLYRFFDKIAYLVKEKKFDDAKKELERIFKIDKKVFDSMKIEADYVYDIITKDTYLYVEMLSFIKDKLPELDKKLEEEKFPQAELAEIKKHQETLFNELYQHLKDIYGLARYEEIRAR
ncbi:hypothetical protein JW756_00580 [Candidatus Woesearchaeota archaeon]|nr:hypothetical protein [Candidatus Woesearchaeota archaeon]